MLGCALPFFRVIKYRQYFQLIFFIYKQQVHTYKPLHFSVQKKQSADKFFVIEKTILPVELALQTQQKQCFLSLKIVYKINIELMSSQNNYGKILAQFNNEGHNQNTTFSEIQLKRVLDNLCQKNAGVQDFNLEVAQELWSETQKNGDGTITLRNFINVVTKAQNILIENIAKSKQQLNVGQSDPERKIELQESLDQYHEDLMLLTVPFKISAPVSAESRMTNSYKNPVVNSRVSQNQSGLEASGFFSGRSSGIFAEVPSKRENSGSLKFTFILTVFLFLMEMIITFHKHHFYSILVYICIFAIVVMGYFDKFYIKFLLVNLALSVVFDFIWVLAQASPYWNPNPPTHHSTIQTPFLRFMYFFVIILMLGKVLLVILLFRYKNNDDTVRKSVTVIGNTFEIDGRVKQNNPVSQLLSGRGVFGSTFQ